MSDTVIEFVNDEQDEHARVVPAASIEAPTPAVVSGGDVEYGFTEGGKEVLTVPAETPQVDPREAQRRVIVERLVAAHMERRATRKAIRDKEAKKRHEKSRKKAKQERASRKRNRR